jgi:hypothetical protein
VWLMSRKGQWGKSHYHIFKNVKVRHCFARCAACFHRAVAAPIVLQATRCDAPHLLFNLQLDWAGENEFGVYYYHPENETISESQQIEPKVCMQLKHTWHDQHVRQLPAEMHVC